MQRPTDVESPAPTDTSTSWILHQGFREDRGRIGRNTGRVRIPRKFAEKRFLLKMAIWSRPENGVISKHINKVVGKVCGVPSPGKEQQETIESWKRKKYPFEGIRPHSWCLIQSDQPWNHTYNKNRLSRLHFYISVHTHIHKHIWNNNNKKETICGDTELA